MEVEKEEVIEIEVEKEVEIETVPAQLADEGKGKICFFLPFLPDHFYFCFRLSHFK